MVQMPTSSRLALSIEEVDEIGGGDVKRPFGECARSEGWSEWT